MTSDRLGLVELLRRGERALLVEGCLRSSRQWFETAYREAESAGRVDEMASAALGLGGCWVHEHRTAAEAAELEARQRRVLACLDPGSVLALRLRTRLAGESDYRGSTHTAVLEMLDETRQVDDPIALAEALSIAHHCLLGPDHGAQRLALANELLLAGCRSGRRGDVLMGQLWRTVDLFLDGDATAERSLAELRGSLAQKDHLAVGFVVSAVEVMLALRGGRLGVAEDLAARCAERGYAAGDADSVAWHATQLMVIRWYQGRVAELAPIFRELVSSPMLGLVDHATYAGLAVASAAAGDARQAASALARLRGREFADVARSSSWLVAMYGAVEAAHLLRDQPASAEAYSLLRPFARLPMMPSLAIACLGSTHHALGVASLTVGELDRAVAHFREAVRHNRALGHVPAAVLSTHRLGEALTLRNGNKDAHQTAADLADAAAEAVSLGMVLPEEWGFETAQRVRPGRPRPNILPVVRRTGRNWGVQLGQRTATVPHSVGMRHLAMLLAHPGQEIPAADLAAATIPRPTAAVGATAASRQPVLDAQATREYRTRLAQITADVEEYERLNDIERASNARLERDWLVAELSAATGLNGRARHFTDDVERSRIAVTKAIRRALNRVAAADPVIGNELQTRVRTGQRCCFLTD